MHRVTFDEKQPHQLMLLLNEVLGEIDGSMKVRSARPPSVNARIRFLQPSVAASQACLLPPLLAQQPAVGTMHCAGLSRIKHDACQARPQCDL